MLRPFRFLWKQMNGPQVTAIFTAIFHYLQKQFNATIDYFRHFSIATANDSHLTLIGAMLNLIRPVISVANSKFFLFTRYPDTDEEHGFASLDNRPVGGLFSDLDEDNRNRTNVLCPASYYRPILLSYIKSNASKNSLVFIDNAINDVWEILNPGKPNPVTYRYYSLGETPNRTAGDLDVTIGDIEEWKGRFGEAEIALQWQGTFEGVFNALFGPEQYIDISFSQEET